MGIRRGNFELCYGHENSQTKFKKHGKGLDAKISCAYKNKKIIINEKKSLIHWRIHVWASPHLVQRWSAVNGERDKMER